MMMIGAGSRDAARSDAVSWRNRVSKETRPEHRCAAPGVTVRTLAASLGHRVRVNPINNLRAALLVKRLGVSEERAHVVPQWWSRTARSKRVDRERRVAATRSATR